MSDTTTAQPTPVVEFERNGYTMKYELVEKARADLAQAAGKSTHYLSPKTDGMTIEEWAKFLGNDVNLSDIVSSWFNKKAVNIYNDSVDETTGQLDHDKWRAGMANLSVSGESKADLIARHKALLAEFLKPENLMAGEEVRKEFQQKLIALNEAIEAKSRKRGGDKEEEAEPAAAAA